MTQSIRPVTAYGLLALVWLLTRAYPLFQAIPWTYWEMWEARKLLEYGFWARQGGIINVHFMTGLLADPEKFNYVNHPYPILWLYTFVTWLGGTWTAFFLNSALGLVSALAVYPALRVFVSSGRALLGAVLALLAPTTILMDVDTNIIALGAMGWPFLVIVLARLEKQPTLGNALLLAGLVFLLGQISWFTYTLFATVFLGLVFQIWASRPNSPGWMRRALIPLVLGAGATLGVLFLQIVWYTYDFSEVLSYAGGQAGSLSEVPLAGMAKAIAIRAALSAGPALLLGGGLGIVLLLAKRVRHWLPGMALLYLGIFAACALVLPRFFYREVTMYEYLVFPLTVAAVAALDLLRNRLLPVALLLISLAGLAYPMYRATIPVVSEASRTLGALLHEHTGATDILATNMDAQKFPFASWDVGSRSYTAMLADRVIRWGVRDATTLHALPANLKSTPLKITYFLSEEIPVQGDLKAFLETQGAPRTLTVELSPEPPSLSTTLRSAYWKRIGKFQVAPDSASQSSHLHFQVFQITLDAPQP